MYKKYLNTSFKREFLHLPLINIQPNANNRKEIMKKVKVYLRCGSKEFCSYLADQ